MCEVVPPLAGSHPATPHSEAETGGQEAGRLHLEGRGRGGIGGEEKNELKMSLKNELKMSSKNELKMSSKK